MTSVQERLKLKRAQIDTWSVREKLCLASSVLRSGDQNWMSVSRSLKVFGDPGRPADWFSQKSCAVQYSGLLENVETPKRKKRTGDKVDSVETPSESIVRRLTQERIEELKRLMQEDRLKYSKLKEEITQVKSGLADDRLDQILADIEDEKRQKVKKAEAHEQWLREREEKKVELERAWKPPVAPASPHRRKVNRNMMRRNSSQSEPSSEADSALDSPLSEPLNVDVIGEENVSETTPVEPKPAPTPTSPLLTSLLKSPSPAPNVQSSSILHSAITSSRGASPTITSLLNSAPGIPGTGNMVSVAPPTTVSPSLKNLVSSAINSEQPHHQLPPPNPSPAAGAPTLSMLLELPPSLPGKPLPELPSAAKATTTLPPSTLSAIVSAAGTPTTTVAKVITVRNTPPATITSPMKVATTVTSTSGTNEVRRSVPETKTSSVVGHVENIGMVPVTALPTVAQPSQVETKENPIEVLIEEVVLHDDSVMDSEILSSQGTHVPTGQVQNSTVKEKQTGEGLKLDSQFIEVPADAPSQKQEIKKDDLITDAGDVARSAAVESNDGKSSKEENIETVSENGSQDLPSDIVTDEGSSVEMVPSSEAEVTSGSVAEVIEIADEQETAIQTEVVDPCLQELEDMEVIILDKMQGLDEVQIVEDMKELECEVVEVVMGNQEKVEEEIKENNEILSQESLKSDEVTSAERGETVSGVESKNIEEIKKSLIESCAEVVGIVEAQKDTEENSLISEDTVKSEGDVTMERASVENKNISPSVVDIKSEDSEVDKGKNKESAKVDKNKESAKVDKNKELAKVDKNKEAVKVDKNKELVKVDKNKESVKVDKNKESVKVDKNKELAKVEKNKEKESAKVDKNKEKEPVKAEKIKNKELLKPKKENVEGDFASQSAQERVEKEDADSVKDAAKDAKTGPTKEVSKKDAKETVKKDVLKESSRKDSLLNESVKKDVAAGDSKKEQREQSKEESISNERDGKEAVKKELNKESTSLKRESIEEPVKEEVSKEAPKKEDAAKQNSSSKDDKKEAVKEKKEQIQRKELKDIPPKETISRNREESKSVNKDVPRKELLTREGSRKFGKEVVKKDQPEKPVVKDNPRESARRDSTKKEPPPKEVVKEIQVKEGRKEPILKETNKKDATSESDSSKLSLQKDVPKKDLPVKDMAKETTGKKEISRRDSKEERKETVRRVVREEKKESGREDLRKKSHLKEMSRGMARKTDGEKKTSDLPKTDAIVKTEKSRRESSEVSLTDTKETKENKRERAVGDAKAKTDEIKIKDEDSIAKDTKQTSVSKAEGENKINSNVDKKETKQSTKGSEETKTQEVSELLDDKMGKRTPQRAETPSTEDDKTNDAEPPKTVGRKRLTTATTLDSVPNSPASASTTDEEKEFRAWKKSIMLLYGRLATHKYASLFLRPITDEQAPGYSSVVHRPIDLLTIKKNIETGVIRSTVEFQRDVMLMFQNSIMYNKSSHFVHKMARQMQQEGMQHIQDFLSTQMLLQVVGDGVPIRRETRTTEANKQRDMLGNPTASTSQDEGENSLIIHKRKRNLGDGERGFKKKKADD